MSATTFLVTHTVVLQTSLGPLVIDLYGADFPAHVAHFLNLLRAEYFHGAMVTTVIPDHAVIFSLPPKIARDHENEDEKEEEEEKVVGGDVKERQTTQRKEAVGVPRERKRRHVDSFESLLPRIACPHCTPFHPPLDVIEPRHQEEKRTSSSSSSVLSPTTPPLLSPPPKNFFTLTISQIMWQSACPPLRERHAPSHTKHRCHKRSSSDDRHKEEEERKKNDHDAPPQSGSRTILQSTDACWQEHLLEHAMEVAMREEFQRCKRERREGKRGHSSPSRRTTTASTASSLVPSTTVFSTAWVASDDSTRASATGSLNRKGILFVPSPSLRCPTSSHSSSDAMTTASTLGWLSVFGVTVTDRPAGNVLDATHIAIGHIASTETESWALLEKLRRLPCTRVLSTPTPTPTSVYHPRGHHALSSSSTIPHHASSSSSSLWGGVAPALFSVSLGHWWTSTPYARWPTPLRLLRVWQATCLPHSFSETSHWKTPHERIMKSPSTTYEREEWRRRSDPHHHEDEKEIIIMEEEVAVPVWAFAMQGGGGGAPLHTGGGRAAATQDALHALLSLAFQQAGGEMSETIDPSTLSSRAAVRRQGWPFFLASTSAVVRVNQLWMAVLSPSSMDHRFRSLFVMHRPRPVDQCLAAPQRHLLALVPPPMPQTTSSSSSSAFGRLASLAEEKKKKKKSGPPPPSHARAASGLPPAMEGEDGNHPNSPAVDPAIVAKREREWHEWFVEEATTLRRVVPTLWVRPSLTAECCGLLPSDDDADEEEAEMYDRIDHVSTRRKGEEEEEEEGVAGAARSNHHHQSTTRSTTTAIPASTLRQQRTVESLSLAMHLLDGGSPLSLKEGMRQDGGQASATTSTATSFHLPEPCERTLFVCKLNPLTTSEGLARCFDASFGPVLSCTILKDPKTGASLCYGFVEFSSAENCYVASEKMNRALIDDYRIVTEFSMSVKKTVRQYDQQNGAMTRQTSHTLPPSADFLKNKDYFENDSPVAQAIREKMRESSRRMP